MHLRECISRSRCKSARSPPSESWGLGPRHSRTPVRASGTSRRPLSGLRKGPEGARAELEVPASVLGVPREEGSRDHESGVTRVQKTLCHKWKRLNNAKLSGESAYGRRVRGIGSESRRWFWNWPFMLNLWKISCLRLSFSVQVTNTIPNIYDLSSK